jgi:hypothetical protein
MLLHGGPMFPIALFLFREPNSSIIQTTFSFFLVVLALLQIQYLFLSVVLLSLIFSPPFFSLYLLSHLILSLLAIFPKAKDKENNCK